MSTSGSQVTGYIAPRRISSAPVGPRPRTADAASAPGISTYSSGVVETLYVHPNVKIVAFPTSAKTLSPSTDVAREEAGTLPASSRVERTIAVGSLRIYRAPGSVAFLNCGSALQPILPKSQCWCIDERNTVFVLQIRRPNYWRIELPSSPTEEEKEKAQSLRGVLDSILQFEKTYCPFQRSFYVELPEEWLTPVVKKPWKPRRQPKAIDTCHNERFLAKHSPSIEYNVLDSEESDSGCHLSDHEFPDITHHSDASNYEERKVYSQKSLHEVDPEGQWQATSRYPALSLNTTAFSTSHSSFAGSIDLPKVAEMVENIQSRVASDLIPVVPRSLAPIETVAPIRTWSPTIDISNPYPWSLPRKNSLAVSDPDEVQNQREPHLPEFRRLDIPTTVTRPSSSPAEFTQTPTEESFTTQTREFSRETPGRASPTPSEESFHSVESWHSSSDEVDDLPSPISSFTTDHPIPSPTALDRLSSVRHRKPHTVETWRPTARSPPPQVNNRLSREITPSQMQRLSGTLNTSKSLPLLLISKTCEFLLGPPTHLIVLMIRIAAKITSGQWRGDISGYTDSEDEIPVHWDYSEDEFGELTDDEQYNLAAEQAARIGASQREGSQD